MNEIRRSIEGILDDFDLGDDTGGETVYLGNLLDETEADELITELHALITETIIAELNKVKATEKDKQYCCCEKGHNCGCAVTDWNNAVSHFNKLINNRIAELKGEG